MSKDEVIPEYGKEGDFQVKRNLEHQDFWKSCLAPDKLELKVLKITFMNSRINSSHVSKFYTRPDQDTWGVEVQAQAHTPTRSPRL